MPRNQALEEQPDSLCTVASLGRDRSNKSDKERKSERLNSDDETYLGFDIFRLAVCSHKLRRMGHTGEQRGQTDS